MKILISNKFYYRRGGDCIYTLNLEQLLKKQGHEVAVFSMCYPENLDTSWNMYFPSNMSRLMAFTRPFGSIEVKNKFTAILKKFKPDIVHLNNIHTQISPIIAEIANKEKIQVVWTLHDYKLLCPRYDCLRNGEIICEDCFDGDKTSCKKFKCMKGSTLASLIGYMEALKWNRERLEANTDIFICPSQFMANKMIQGGFRKDKMKVLCNFIDIERCKINDYTKEDYYCFIGRLSHEKGIKTLLKAANQLPYKLKIIGGGPLFDEMKKLASPNIELVGFKQWDEIKALVSKARFSVIPSEWYENNPLSVIEAQCLGTPVLGARMGGIPELIEEGISGMTFTSKDIEDLKEKIKRMFETSFDYQNIALKSQEKYNADKYYNELIKIYTGNYGK